MSSHQAHRALNDALPAVAKIRVNLISPRAAPLPVSCTLPGCHASSVGCTRTWVCGMPCGVSSRGCPPASRVALDGLGVLEGKQAGGRARPGAKARGHEPLTRHRCSSLARLDLGLPLPSLIPGLGRTEEELPAESTRPETTPRSPRVADAPAEHPTPTAMCQLDVLSLHTARPSYAEGCETSRQGRTAPYGCSAETPAAR